MVTENVIDEFLKKYLDAIGKLWDKKQLIRCWRRSMCERLRVL